MPTLQSLHALEILDSRGRPTLYTTCTLEGGVVGAASVPSGASTGKAEARELRDGEARRYGGLGCRMATSNVNEVIAGELTGKQYDHQAALDEALIALDGTPDKFRLGANALLSVSMAFARACASYRDIPLYQHFAEIIGCPLERLPRMTINLFSGGKHAGGQVAIQDVLVIPASAETIDEGLAMTYAVYQAAAEHVADRYGGRALTADEGGLAPPFADIAAMLDATLAAIEAAGYAPGRDVFMAIDVASSHFYEDGCYHLGDEMLSSTAMIERIAGWVQAYPIVSVEDGLMEDDWSHWPLLCQALPEQTLVLGDDLLCTNASRIRRAIQDAAANALLLKVNQVGTLTEASQAYALAREAGWHVTVSARSGETEDNWLADLAVGWGGDQIKVGSITQSERLAKYNRLLMIEADTGLPVTEWPTVA